MNSQTVKVTPRGVPQHGYVHQSLLAGDLTMAIILSDRPKAKIVKEIGKAVLEEAASS